MVAFGVLFLSTGPFFALWLVILQRRAHLLVIAILSAFAWCIALMLAAAFWLAVPPLKKTYPWVLFLSVTMQELARFALSYGFRTLGRLGDNVKAFLRPGVKNQFRTSAAVGAGFGFMSIAVNFYSIVASELSDDTGIYVEHCPVNFVVAGSLFALAFYILHLLLAILVWPAYYVEMGWLTMFVIYGLHLGASEVTLLNRRQNGCIRGLIAVWSIDAILFCLTIGLTKHRLRPNVGLNNRGRFDVDSPLFGESRPNRPVPTTSAVHVNP